MYIDSYQKIRSYLSYVITIVFSILLQIEWSISVFIFFNIFDMHWEQGDLSPTISDSRLMTFRLTSTFHTLLGRPQTQRADALFLFYKEQLLWQNINK